MANRYFKGNRQCLEPAIVDLFGQATFSSGAVAATSHLIGFTMTQNTTGIYDVVLEDIYYGLRQVNVKFDGEYLDTWIDGIDVNTTNKTLQIKVVNAAGALTDPADTTTMYIQIILKNSSVDI